MSDPIPPGDLIGNQQARETCGRAGGDVMGVAERGLCKHCERRAT